MKTKGRYLVRVYLRDSIEYFHTIGEFDRKEEALQYAHELATHNGVLMLLVYTRAEKGKAPKIILKQYTTEGLVYLMERRAELNRKYGKEVEKDVD